jgi:hypothetical protein
LGEGGELGADVGKVEGGRCGLLSGGHAVFIFSRGLASA